MPPGYWSKYLWALLHGLCQRIDQLILEGKLVLLIEVAQFLRAFCRLLPCPECKMHFTNLLQTDLISKPKNGFFSFSVAARAKIAKRLGKPVRDESYCRQEFNTEWFSLAWNALQIMSFAYPLAADAAYQADTKFFFQFLGKFFPFAVASDWSSTIGDIVSMTPKTKTVLAIPINHRKLMSLDVPGLVKESSIVSDMALNKFDTSKPWCATRENFMHTVYTLRKTVQKTPLLVVPPFETLIQQWVNELTQYVVKFRTGLSAEEVKEPFLKEPFLKEPSSQSKEIESKHQLKQLERKTQLNQKKLDQLELQLRLAQDEEEKKKRKASLQQTHNETLRSELEALKKAFDVEKVQFKKSQEAFEEERALFLSQKKAFQEEKFLFERNQKIIIS